MPQTSDLLCETLTSFTEAQKLAPEWQALYERAGSPLFRDFNSFENWWRTLGQEEAFQIYIAIAKTPSGELRAVLPLVIRKRGIFSIIEQAGQEVFDNGDVLATNKEDAAALIHYIAGEDSHDIAFIRDIRENDLSTQALASSMQLHKQHKNHFLILDFASGSEWYAAQSRKFRSDVHRKSKKLGDLGELQYGVWRRGQEPPEAVVDSLYEQKKAWALSRGLSEIFILRERMKNFLRGLVLDSAQKDILYLAWLKCGDKIIACHLGFVKNNALSLYMTSYDEAFSRFSPGLLLIAETIKEAIDEGLGELDYMRGEEEYKLRFCSGHRLLSDYIDGHSLLGRAAVGINRIIHGHLQKDL
ncbi:MAG: GNAT family N-acetyltransferase [Alphaproteobacteria bacterium]|nr:GNAT family N-acetyltransferase [Alphaproteobacteria bacterium]